MAGRGPQAFEKRPQGQLGGEKRDQKLERKRQRKLEAGVESVTEHNVSGPPGSDRSDRKGNC